MSLAALTQGNRDIIDKQRYRAPLFTALFLLFAFYDYLTLKTGILTQPFVPCLNFVINAAWTDRAMLLDCTIHTLGLLFLGYFIGVAVGLVTGNHLRLFQPLPLLGGSDHQVLRADPDLHLDPDHDGGGVFPVPGRHVYYRAGLLVRGDGGFYDPVFPMWIRNILKRQEP